MKDDSGDSQYFSINSYTGVIHTRASFDREQKGSYLIEVQSQDSSESARPGQQGQPNTGGYLTYIHYYAYTHVCSPHTGTPVQTGNLLRIILSHNR